MDIIGEFASIRGLQLDDFQVQACKAIHDGYSVLVAAPTGSGKTLIADFAIFLQSNSAKRVIYTTPIKALSNQKFAEFSDLYGADNVGLATGDRSIRSRASVVIMTTEVLRNMIYTDPRSLEEVSHVILDEVHYISDRSRGAVWEEVIIQLPLEIDLVCLSATVSNAEEVAQWLTTVRGSTRAIIHETRPVPLSYWYSFRKRRQGIHVLPLLTHSDHDEMHIHPDLYRALRPKRSQYKREQILSPRRLDLIEYLDSNSMLPAIFFIFSRAGCDEALQSCFNTHMQLTTIDERQMIREICDRHLDALGAAEFDALDYDIVTHAMERGFAPHHAGLIPPLREAVEEAFVRGLIKVVFATETLAVGVNMPAKTVVIEKLTKFNGESHQMLTPGEFTQLTGRAGRRGIDTAGHALVEWNRFVDFEQAGALASTRSYALKSSFRPTYNMATNLIRTYSPDHARHILNLSFAQYQADDAVVSLERNLETKQRRMNEIRLEFPHTDKQFSGMVHKRAREIDKLGKSQLAPPTHNQLFRNLHLGDILDGFVQFDPCIVVSKGSARREGFVKVIDIHGRTHNISVDQLSKGVHIIGRIKLDSPIAIRTKQFRTATAKLLKTFIDSNRTNKTPANVSPSKSNKAVRQREMLDEYISCMTDLKRLTRRVQSRGQSLARQFERILALLGEYGYVNGWELTERGHILAKINAEADLVIAEHIYNASFGELSCQEFAAMLASLVFDTRGDSPQQRSVFPTKHLEAISAECESFVYELNRNEREAGLTETRGLDYTMMYPAYKWASGTDLHEILQRHEIAGGDFVRAIKSIVDLVRQIEKATGDSSLINLCQTTQEACFRDIIEISS